MDFPDVVSKCDILFAIGGDGTILSTVRRLGKFTKPIMGIHIGGLGFLSECTEDNLDTTIDKVLNNQFIISDRMLLEVQIALGQKKKQSLWALNDIIVDEEEDNDVDLENMIQSLSMVLQYIFLSFLRFVLHSSYYFLFPLLN